MTLEADHADRFEQDLHRQVGELLNLANTTDEEINRLLFLSVACELQALDFRRAADRRIRKLGATP